MNSRNKGKVGEREAAEVLRELGFYGARRGVQYQGGPDSPDVVGIPGVHVEVKRTERLNIDAAMAQARADAGPSQVPIVMHRRNRGVWMVTVDIANLEAGRSTRCQACSTEAKKAALAAMSATGASGEMKHA